jgi:hypothetical protein
MEIEKFQFQLNVEIHSISQIFARVQTSTPPLLSLHYISLTGAK